MFKLAHFCSFSFNLIIDPKSLNRPIIFEFNNMEFKFHAPYKSYPYNHDFSYKPQFYFNSEGKIEKLSGAFSFGSYPMYDENYRHIGMILQDKNIYSFEDSQKLVIDHSIAIPSNFNYVAVDTLRFDTSNHFNDHSPEFLSTFFAHLRNISNQFWISKPRMENEGVSIEAEIKFNRTLYNFKPYSNLISIIRYNKGVPITYEIWNEALQNTINNVDVDFAKSLFLDAVYERATHNIRAVVLNLANSIDITVNMLFKEIDNNNSEFERQAFVEKKRLNKKVSSTFIPGLISEFLEPLINRNYKNEKPVNYEIIKNFWLNNRNIIAHGGVVNFNDDNKLNSLFDATDDLLNWLSDVRKEL